MDNRSIRKLEAELWESADLLRAGSKLTSNQYCMPVLGLIFLRYSDFPENTLNSIIRGLPDDLQDRIRERFYGPKTARA